MVGGRRLFSGPGGSGRTHQLRAWADATERRIPGRVRWIRGSFDHRRLTGPPRRLLETVESVTADDAIAIDDAHWLHDEVVERLLHHIDLAPIAVARAGYPDGATLSELDDALTVHDPADRLTARTRADVADWIDSVGSNLDAADVVQATGGWAGLVALLLESEEWPRSPAPPSVVDVVVRRARASGADVVRAAQMMTMGADIATAVRLAHDEPDGIELSDVERRLRVSGLLAVISSCRSSRTSLRSDLTEIERSALIDRLTVEPHRLPRDTRDRLVLARPARAPDASELAERVSAAVRLGDPSAAALLASLSDLSEPTAADAAFALDMRAMRWERAGTRPIVGPTASRRLALAAALAGDLTARPHEPTETSEVGLLDDIAALLRAHADRDDRDLATIGTLVVDDAIATRVDVALGWSVAAIAAPVVAASGDPSAAASLLRRAADVVLGGAGETRAHLLLAAYFELVGGDYGAALDLVRVGADATWPHRDQLLLAGLDAAVARRSGDTTRLRDAWQRCDPLLTRQSVTWLLLDPLIEIVAAGRRVGDSARVQSVVDALCRQMEPWNATGRGPIDRRWLRLQVAVAGEDWETVEVLGAELGGEATSVARSAARSCAGSVWSAIASRQLGRGGPLDEQLDAAVDQLTSVGDAWEASRLLGQTALDHPDPAAARSLLERARSLVAEPVDAADGLVAAGLSERESDVARLVVEGRTYKEIGAQLFISAKTVEHHVARIRQRLGAGSRAELLATIRELSADSAVSRGSSADLW